MESTPMREVFLKVPTYGLQWVLTLRRFLRLERQYSVSTANKKINQGGG
jgi:hypothetical protein